MAARNVSSINKEWGCCDRAFPSFVFPVPNGCGGVRCLRDHQSKYAPMGVGCRIYRALHSVDPVASAQAGCSYLSKPEMRRRASAQDSRWRKHIRRPAWICGQIDLRTNIESSHGLLECGWFLADVGQAEMCSVSAQLTDTFNVRILAGAPI